MEEHIKKIIAELRPGSRFISMQRTSSGTLIRTEAADGLIEIHHLWIDFLGFAKNPEDDNFETTESSEKY